MTMRYPGKTVRKNSAYAVMISDTRHLPVCEDTNIISPDYTLNTDAGQIIIRPPLHDPAQYLVVPEREVMRFGVGKDDLPFERECIAWIA